MRRRPATAMAVLAAAGALLAAPAASAQDRPTGRASTALQHVVLVTQDHRSFDHYFGTRAGVDGLPADACQPSGGPEPCSKPFHLTASASLTPFNDGRRYLQAQINGGKMDGFVSAYRGSASDGALTMGYYTRTDLPYYSQLADEFMLMDHYFAAVPANGVANRYFSVTAATTPRDETSVPANGWPDAQTIFDRLSQANVSWKIYLQGYGPTQTAAQAARFRARVPLLALAKNRDAASLAGHLASLDQYYTDAAQNTLPSVSYVVATGATERPPASPAAGEKFVRTLVTGLQASKAWPQSALLLDYDSSGGWYDHVAPPAAAGAARGARVPALLVSPLARPGAVDGDVMDSAAGLRLIEENWALAPLTERDRTSPSLLGKLNLTAHPAPKLTGPTLRVRTPFSQVGGIYLVYGLVLALAAVVASRLRKPPESQPKPETQTEPAPAELVQTTDRVRTP